MLQFVARLRRWAGGYWVAERWENGELMARWTSKELGSTAPFNLMDILDDLRARDDWKVYKVGWPEEE